MKTVEDRINVMFNEFVPHFGKADTVAGEIIRAIARISYRNYNDGDRIGVGYGKETCNPAARYLMTNTNREIADAIALFFSGVSEDIYDDMLKDLEGKILDYLEQNPALKTTPNNKDMWDYETSEDYYNEEEWE